MHFPDGLDIHFRRIGLEAQIRMNNLHYPCARSPEIVGCITKKGNQGDGLVVAVE